MVWAAFFLLILLGPKVQKKKCKLELGKKEEVQIGKFWTHARLQASEYCYEAT